jgi:serine/threonine-protein kinase
VTNHTDRSGEVLDGRYRLDRLLGEGGIGQVYEGKHLITGRRVAVKFLLDEVANNAQVVGRFYREARAAAAIGSEHICEVLDMRPPEQGRPFLVMEFLDGEDLRTILDRKIRLSLQDVIEIFSQVLDGLAAAHDAGIVHRDIKPENIFLVRQAAGAPLVKLLDFGVSKYDSGLEDGKLTMVGTILGSPSYMSPEQASGAVDLGPAADLYSVGVVLYEVLTGEVPFDAPTFTALVIKIATEPSPDPCEGRDWVPRELGDVVLKAMSREPEWRYPSARAMRAALLRAIVPDADDDEEDVQPTLVVAPEPQDRGGEREQPSPHPLPPDTPEERSEPPATGPTRPSAPIPSFALPAEGLPVPSFSDDSYYGGDDDDLDDGGEATEIAPMLEFEEKPRLTDRPEAEQSWLSEVAIPEPKRPPPPPDLPEPAIPPATMVLIKEETAPVAPAPSSRRATPRPVDGTGLGTGLITDEAPAKPLPAAAIPRVVSTGAEPARPTRSLPLWAIVVPVALLVFVGVFVIALLGVRSLLTSGAGGSGPDEQPVVGVAAPAPVPVETPVPAPPQDPAQAVVAPPVPPPTPQAVDAGAATVAEAGVASPPTSDGGVEPSPAPGDAGGGDDWTMTDEAAAALQEPAPPGMVRVVIRVTPPEATIYVDGRQLPRNPAILTLPNDGHSRAIRAWARGYRPQETRFTAFWNREIALTLEQISPAPRGP